MTFYRDLDTIQRFAMIINARDSVIEEIRKLKAAVMVPPSAPANPQPEPPVEEAASDAAAFQVGQIVTPKSNPSLRGAIVAIIPGQPENRYFGLPRRLSRDLLRITTGRAPARTLSEVFFTGGFSRASHWHPDPPSGALGSLSSTPDASTAFRTNFALFSSLCERNAHVS